MMWCFAINGRVLARHSFRAPNLKLAIRHITLQMEEEFKGELAVIWGVEDEDDLPDNLQVCVFEFTIGLIPSACLTFQ